MFFDRKDFSDQILLDLYRTLLFPRMIEEKMLVLLRQGRISKWFSGIGQEAISAGAVRALWMALELSRKQALDMGYSLIRIGSDPESIAEGQAKFAGGQRIEPRIR